MVLGFGFRFRSGRGRQLFRSSISEEIRGVASNNIRTLIFRIGFWGMLYYIYNREPPKSYLILVII